MARGVEIPITATDRTGQAFASVQRRMAQFERSAKALRQAALGFAALGAASGASVQRVVEITDRIGKAAQTADVSAESLQRLRFAFGQLAGTTARDVDLSLQRFNRRLGLARTGVKTYADAFGDLGVALNQDTQPALRAALVSLAEIDSASERAAKASQIFGEEAGPKIASALSQGIEAVDRLSASIPGMVSDENVAKAAALNDAMGKLSLQFSAEFANAVLDNGDALLQFASAAGAMASTLVEAIGALQAFANRFGAFTQGVILSDARAELAGVNSELERQRAALEGMEGATGRGQDGRRGKIKAEIALLEQESRALEARVLAAEAVLNARMATIPEMSSGVTLGDVPRLDRGTGGMPVPTISPVIELLPQDAQQAVAQIDKALEKATKSEGDGGSAFQGVEDALASSIVAGVQNGSDAALDVFASFLQRMALQALESSVSDALGSIIGALGGPAGTTTLGGGKSIAKIPGKAVGGTVTGGKRYIVGEKGPEVYEAGRTGTITPNNAIGGGLTYSPTVTINGGATEQDRILFQRQLDAQKAEIFDLARRGRL